ncbi:putative quinol monooxygenase [Vibrio parahaemolyticus]|nr:antibiotic biosynthesis monooxygenase [Vibrio parahaemolyticus]
MIHLVAEVKAYPDSKDQVVNLLAGLLEPTRQEEGCCQYELYLDEKVEGLFMFQEIWASQENDWVEYTQIRPLRFIA